MARFLKFVALGLLVLLVLLAIALFVLLRTPPGLALLDQISRPQIERLVRAQLNSDITYDQITGTLPGRIRLGEVRLSHDGEVWASLDAAALDWSPFSFLGGRHINVSELSVTRPTLHRLPPPLPEPAPRAEDDAKDRPSGALPKVTVERLLIDRFTVEAPVLGQRYVATLEVSGRLDGRMAESDLALYTEGRTDEVTAKLTLTGDRLSVDGQVSSVPNGLIANLAQANGPINLTIEGDEPLSAWRGRIIASVGGYGTLQGEVAGDLQTLTSGAVDVAATFGELIPTAITDYTGQEVRLAAQLQQAGDEYAITVERLSGGFGEAKGTLTLPTGTGGAYVADLSGTISQRISAQLNLPTLAGPFTAKATASQVDHSWSITSDVSTNMISASVREGRSSGDEPFVGTLTATAKSLPFDLGPLAPFTEERLTARADLRLGSDGQIDAQNLTVQAGATAPRRLEVTGRASVSPAAQRISSSLNLSVGRDIVTALVPELAVDGPIQARLSAQGVFDDLEANVTADLPSGEHREMAFAPSTLIISATGLPTRPSGDLTLQSADGNYSASAEIRSEGESIRIPTLIAEAGALRIVGNAVLERETGAANADLTVDAGDGTNLLGLLTLGGQYKLSAAYGGKNGAIDARLSASGMIIDSQSIRELTVTLAGPLENLRFALSADSVVIGDREVAGVASEGTVAVGTELGTLVDLRTLRLDFGQPPDAPRLELLAPTQLTIGEDIRLADTTIAWPSGGQVRATGTLSARRWVAAVDLDDVDLPGEPQSLNGRLRIDTDAATPARLSLSAMAISDGDETYTLSADGIWDGQDAQIDLALTEGEANRLMEATVRQPVRLNQGGEQISLDVPAEGLAGTLTVNGPLDPIYTFLPDLPASLTGNVKADLTLAGSYLAPRAMGVLTLSDGRFEENTVGLVFSKLQGTSNFSYTPNGAEGTLTLTGAGAQSRDRSIRLDARLALEGQSSEVEADLTLDRATVVRSPELEVLTTGTLRLAGSLTDLLASGEINIVRATAQLPALAGGSDSGSAVTPVNVVRLDAEEDARAADPPAPEAANNLTMGLDLKVTAQDEIFIRGRGLDSEWSTDLTITGTADAPAIAGSIDNIDGRFDFASRRFELTEGVILFPGGDPLNGLIEVAANYETGEATATIEVSGGLSAPTLSLTSTPALPQEDVLALVLFGKSPTQLSAVESLQIAAAVAQLTGAAGMGGAGVIGDLRDSIGVDTLSLGLDEETGARTLAVGKYVSDKLYVGAKQSLGEAGTEITVIYDVLNNITLESTLQPNGGQSVSAKYKRDY